MATVVPKQPFLAVKDGIRFVGGIVIPFVLARENDRVGGEDRIDWGLCPRQDIRTRGVANGIWLAGLES